MVYSRTVVKVIDNSGATYVKAISVVGGKKRQYGKLYDQVLVVPKKIKRKSKKSKVLVQKRKKYVAIIMATSVNTRRRDGSFLRFLVTSAALFNLTGKLVGSAIRAPLCREIKSAQGASLDIKKLVSLARTYI